jgi:hypothetical protein
MSRERATGEDHVYFATHKSGRERRETLRMPLSVAILDDDILSFYVSKLMQALPKCLKAFRKSRSGAAPKKSYPGEFR